MSSRAPKFLMKFIRNLPMKKDTRTLQCSPPQSTFLPDHKRKHKLPTFKYTYNLLDKYQSTSSNISSDKSGKSPSPAPSSTTSSSS